MGPSLGYQGFGSDRGTVAVYAPDQHMGFTVVRMRLPWQNLIPENANDNN